jgi:hypothetical protein
MDGGLGAVKSTAPSYGRPVLAPPPTIEVPVIPGVPGTTWTPPPLPSAPPPPPPGYPPPPPQSTKPPSVGWFPPLIPTITKTPTPSPGYLPPRDAAVPEIPTIPPPTHPAFPPADGSVETQPPPTHPPLPPAPDAEVPPQPSGEQTEPPSPGNFPDSDGSEDSGSFLPTTSMAKAILWARGHKKELAIGVVAVAAIGVGWNLLRGHGPLGSAASGNANWPRCVKFRARTGRCLEWSDGWKAGSR